MWSRLKSTAGAESGDEGEQSEDSYDIDYEENAGDEFALYDSPLENVDELIIIKETLDTIQQ